MVWKENMGGHSWRGTNEYCIDNEKERVKYQYFLDPHFHMLTQSPTHNCFLISPFQRRHLMLHIYMCWWSTGRKHTDSGGGTAEWRHWGWNNVVGFWVLMVVEDGLFGVFLGSCRLIGFCRGLGVNGDGVWRWFMGYHNNYTL